MTLILFCILWVIATEALALLPTPLQYVPGTVLMMLGPVLILLIWLDVGIIMAALAICAFASLYRNPLIYYWTRIKGFWKQVSS